MNPERVVASRHVARVIRCTPEQVYEFAVDPANLPTWAAGLANSPVTIDGDRLIAESPMGSVTVRFVPRNDLGVLDHDVTLPSGTVVNNPVRVLSHPNGAEILFTVRQIELSDEEFERDLDMVAEDLKRLAEVLEAQ
ncbi:SRPBCC family protein [Rhodococcus sp. Leaf278]|uniref:SRPBCC family protein n=1 Tax=Rhodococcus sp. Leaf278 TaxID=1736319 RepID=UPI000AA331CC|nr:SRPBCC family protein [Rhodococcus sp. Leaf278]